MFSEALIAPTGASAIKTLSFAFRTSREGSVGLDWAQFEAPIPAGPSVYPGTRDPFLWPFTSTSIWNMPLHRNAVYEKANFPTDVQAYGIDVVWIMKENPSDPLVPVKNMGGAWRGRCDKPDSALPNWHNISLRTPMNLYIPGNNSPYGLTPNSVFAYVRLDGTTIEGFPIAKCSPIGAFRFPSWTSPVHDTQSIYGDGNPPAPFKAHGATFLSGLGGVIRKGELSGPDPIRHVLSLTLSHKGLYFNKATQQGYVWPARNHDISAARTYIGTNPKVTMGSLLAIPPDVTPNQLGIETPQGRKLFYALQNYGAYATEGGGPPTWSANRFQAEHGVEQELGATGLRSTFTNAPIGRDMKRLYGAMYAVTSNGPNTIGGGLNGDLVNRRAPLAPPLNP